MKVAIILLSALVCTISCTPTPKPAPSTAQPAKSTDAAVTKSTPSHLIVERRILKAKAEQLVKEAEKEIKVLKAEGKSSQAAVLKKEELNLKKLISILVGVEQPHQLREIEAEVSQAEKRLEEHIANLKANDHKGSTPAHHRANTQSKVTPNQA